MVSNNEMIIFHERYCNISHLKNQGIHNLGYQNSMFSLCFDKIPCVLPHKDFCYCHFPSGV